MHKHLHIGDRPRQELAALVTQEAAQAYADAWAAALPAWGHIMKMLGRVRASELAGGRWNDPVEDQYRANLANLAMKYVWFPADRARRARAVDPLEIAYRDLGTHTKRVLAKLATPDTYTGRQLLARRCPNGSTWIARSTHYTPLWHLVVG
jgi:hypothetical protein